MRDRENYGGPAALEADGPSHVQIDGKCEVLPLWEHRIKARGEGAKLVDK